MTLVSSSNPVIVKKSFMKCSISNSPDGERDDCLWKDSDNVPDQTVDNELDPYDDALPEVDML